MKRFISALLTLALAATMLCGCKKEDGRPFDYDLSEYMTLGDYIGIEYTYEVAPVTQEQVDAFIQAALAEKGYGTEETVTDRAVQTGDKVNIDFVGKKDGVAFEGGTSQGYDLVIGSNSFIDGFESGLIGATVGETRNLNLTFPENYGNEELNGQAVVFEVKINSIKTTVYPELTDAVVQEISDHSTVDDYLAYANSQVLVSNTQTADATKENNIWAAVLENITFKKFPEKEMELFKEFILEQQDLLAQQQYGKTYEELLEENNMTLDDIEEDLTAEAEAYAKHYMAYVAITRDQDIEVTDEEYEQGLQDYADANGYTSLSEVKEAVDEDLFYLSLVGEKAMNFVIENAVEVKE